MPVATIDLDDGLAALLAGDLQYLNTDIVAPATPLPTAYGENVRSALQALIARSNGEDPFPAGTIPQTAVDDVIYEIDFSTLGNNTITDGTESIDGLNWTAVNSAELGTFAIQNGTGLRMVAATSNGGASTMTSASQLAAHIYLPLSSLPNYDPRRPLIVEIYCTNIVLEASGEGVLIGVFGPAGVPTSTSAARMRQVGIYNDGSARCVRSTSQTTATSTDDTRTTHDVLGFHLEAFGTGTTWSGVYSSGFPRLVVPATIFPNIAGATDPLSAASARLIIALATANDASPTTAATVRTLRVRQ